MVNNKEKYYDDYKVVFFKCARGGYKIYDYANDFFIFFPDPTALPYIKCKINKIYNNFVSGGDEYCVTYGNTWAIDTEKVFMHSNTISGNYLKGNRWLCIKDFIDEIMKDYNIKDKIDIDKNLSLCDMVSIIAYNKSGGKYGK